MPTASFKVPFQLMATRSSDHSSPVRTRSNEVHSLLKSWFGLDGAPESTGLTGLNSVTEGSTNVFSCPIQHGE